MSTKKLTAEEEMYLPLMGHALDGDVKSFESVANEQNKEIDINCGNEYGSAFLIIASENGHANMVAYLLGKGAIVDKPSKLGFTALCCAAARNHLDTLRLLLEKGADPNCQPYDEGEFAFPLYMAAVKNYAEVCELLLQFGANVNQNVMVLLLFKWQLKKNTLRSLRCCKPRLLRRGKSKGRR